MYNINYLLVKNCCDCVSDETFEEGKLIRELRDNYHTQKTRLRSSERELAQKNLDLDAVSSTDIIDVACQVVTLRPMPTV